MKVNFIQIIFLLQLLQIELKDNITGINSSKTYKNKNISEIIELNDSNFDLVIRNGNYNRWIILFYIELCYHCHRAREILNKIIKSKNYKEINNIKFASIEVNNNTKTNIRFNASEVPQIILVENNTMLEFESFVNERNLVNFIETNFNNATKYLKPFPKRNYLKYYYLMLENSFSNVLDQLNNFINGKKTNFQFNVIAFILGYIILCFILWTFVIYGIMKCFDTKKNNIENKNEIKKIMEENKEKEIEENESEEEDNNYYYNKKRNKKDKKKKKYKRN